MKKETTKYLKREFIDDKKLIILSVTKRCNLCCIYCRTNGKWYDSLGQGSNMIDLPKEKWPKLLDICKNSAEVLITGGEPTEYPLLKDFLIFLSTNGIRFSIHTNGISKKWDDILTFLKTNNISPDIHLSVELFPKLQKDLRGCDLPLKFISNAKKLELLLELKINLHQQLSPYKNKLKDNLYSWLERGVDSIFFQPIAPVGENFPRGLKINKSFIPFLEELKRIKLEDPVLKKIIRKSETGLDVIISFIKKTDLYKIGASKCNAYNQIIFIDSDLKIMNCKTLWNRKEDVPCSDLFDFICCGFQS